MTDDTIEPTDSTINHVERQPEPVLVIEPEPTAKEKLRAFEDANFGPDVVRVNDQIERGRGSPFADMDDDKRKHYQALENLIDAESKVADTSAALASAEAAHAAALAAVAARENDASG